MSLLLLRQLLGLLTTKEYREAQTKTLKIKARKEACCQYLLEDNPKLISFYWERLKKNWKP